MDVQLPNLSGLDATRRLRQDPTTAEHPDHRGDVLRDERRRQKAQEAGASAYLAKPYSPRELLALIRKFAPEA